MMKIFQLKTLALIIFSVLSPPDSQAQKSFTGSFMMKFTSSGEVLKKDPPMFWNADSGKVMMEIQDEMYKKGVSKRVLFTPADSTWTMIMHLNSVREAVRVHANAMFRDTMKSPRIKIKMTTEKKVIEGYECKKIIIENEEYADEAWIAPEINFDNCKVYKLLCHCGLMGEFAEKGNWYLMKKPKGMVMEATSRKKITGETVTVSISEFKPGIIKKELFNLKDFKFSDIPEGQSCGAMVKEKEK